MAHVRLGELDLCDDHRGTVLPAFFADEIVPNSGNKAFGMARSGKALRGLPQVAVCFCSTASCLYSVPSENR